ncbi:di-heme oxidoredictase family protein [Cystobacter fuscus]|uniref:di-heme oxidoreductase family protein n=1 Tax=Cystobacter fuscus TaxID=43 RepID=UPI002B2EF013|nr:c-type cytochrome [Cystobacter fuscus]
MKPAHTLVTVGWGLLVACGPTSRAPDDGPHPSHAVVEAGEERPGGGATVRDTSAQAFSRPAPSLSPSRLSAFGAGEALFEADWFAAPDSREDRDGLGPLFNSVSCEACHFQNGRGAPPQGSEQPTVSLLLRLSVPGEGEHGGPRPEPTYGDQLQTRSISGVPTEGRTTLTWEESSGTFADGEPWTLRAPVYVLSRLAHGPLSPDVRLSPRVAQPLVGPGLLAAVPEESLLEWADPEDADGDGISGRPNRVWSVRRGRWELGRFGWKANQPDLEQQNAAAMRGDLGITSPLFPTEACTAAQATCLSASSGGAPELDEGKLAALTAYTAALAVPARRGHDQPQVLQGKDVFHRVGCARCHRPSLETGEVEGRPELSHQRVWPYSDLLLHDLGEALADGYDDFLATGNEWRTPPLWGLGLTRTVSGHTRLLHDGRARTVLEAILWHGGEAQAARDTVLRLSRAERDALLAFLDSL